MPAVFIFANLNGTIAAWNGGNNATIERTTSGAVYTGLAIATNTQGNFLYATNDAQGKIDVFDGSFNPHSFGSNAFVDPKLPTGLVPFDIKLINGNLFVAYAPAGHNNQAGAKPGQGAVAAFTTTGRFLTQIITGGVLASPWGMALAPAGFGTFSGDLLVGNFAYNDSVINAFNPSTGAFVDTLADSSGHAIANPGLWTLTFGNGVNGGDANTLYFTAGIDGETHGLLGSIQSIPPLSPTAPIVTNLPNGAFQNLTTVPSNGDLNPYGVAIVPPSFPSGGTIKPGDTLVSNFNNNMNQQGTGTTITDIAPNGSESLFFQDSAAPGLDTALGVLKSGFVIVGNLPGTYDSHGNLLSIGQGSLLILDKSGHVVTTITDSVLLDGPWDLTINDQGSTAQVFVSNALNGVVTRIDLSIPQGGDPIVGSMTRIASGYLTRTDPVAFVIGPTGVAFDSKTNTLFVASTGDNMIFAIPNAKNRTSDAGMGSVVYADNAHLRGPLGLVLAPNGNLIAANGDAINPDPTQTSELVEFTTGGQFVDQFSLDPSPGGAFGLDVTNANGLLRLAAVDDNTNSLQVWTFQSDPPASRDVIAVAGSPGAGTNLTSTGNTSPSQAVPPSGPQAMPVLSVEHAPVPQLGTTDSTSDPNSSNTVDATGVRHKGIRHRLRALERHVLHSTLLGQRHSRGHEKKDATRASRADAVRSVVD
jgi:hypothetical protein